MGKNERHGSEMGQGDGRRQVVNVEVGQLAMDD